MDDFLKTETTEDELLDKKHYSILEISFPQERRGQGYTFDMAGATFTVTSAPSQLTINQAEEMIKTAQGRFDAVALSGFALTYTVGNRYHRHRLLRKLLIEDDNAPTVVCDGIRAKDTVERLMVKRIVDILEGEITQRRILVLSCIDRWGVSEILSGMKSQVIFGDLMYNFRFGIPLFSLDQVRRVSPLIINVVTRAPLDWYFPGVRTHRRLLPRWRFAFYWAEVIVGGMNFFKRYSPTALDGKIVISNIISSDEVEWFKSKGVSTIASLTPVICGERVSASVMEAALTLVTRGKTGHRRDRFLNEIMKLELDPEVFVFQPSSAQIPESFSPSLAPNQTLVEQDKFIPSDFLVQIDVAKFAFVIHPLVGAQLLQHKLIRKFRHFLPMSVLESVAAKTPNFIASRLKNLTSVTGQKAEGWLLALPITSKIMLRLPPEYIYERLIELSELAQELGATVMGLGAFTSVVGDAGVSVARHSPIAITTGNSYTVASTMETIEIASNRIGINVKNSVGLVVGATGSIGSVLARMLAERVREIVVVSPRPERVVALGKMIKNESPCVIVTTTTNIEDHIQRADIVVTTTSTVDPIISVEKLKPGSLVCDVARPPDIDEEIAMKRPDILVVESGEISPPSTIEIGVDIGLPPNTVYACLAETMILSLEGVKGHYTIGRNIMKDRVEEIWAMGKKHGFKLAGLRTFGKAVDEAKLDIVANARERMRLSD